jgi:hypothetical protein
VKTLNDINLNFKYSTIENATGAFNDANKLGQGGFGTVYKVVSLLSTSPWPSPPPTPLTICCLEIYNFPPSHHREFCPMDERLLSKDFSLTIDIEQPISTMKLT